MFFSWVSGHPTPRPILSLDAHFFNENLATINFFTVLSVKDKVFRNLRQFLDDDFFTFWGWALAHPQN